MSASKDCPAINAKVCGNPLCSEHFPGPDLTQTAEHAARANCPACRNEIPGHNCGAFLDGVRWEKSQAPTVCTQGHRHLKPNRVMVRRASLLGVPAWKEGDSPYWVFEGSDFEVQWDGEPAPADSEVVRKFLNWVEECADSFGSQHPANRMAAALRTRPGGQKDGR